MRRRSRRILQIYSKVLQNLAEALRYNTLEKMGRCHLVRDDRFSLPPQTINRESWPTVIRGENQLKCRWNCKPSTSSKGFDTSNSQLQIPKTTSFSLQDTSVLPVSRKLWTCKQALNSPRRVLTLHFSNHSSSFKLSTSNSKTTSCSPP